MSTHTSKVKRFVTRTLTAASLVAAPLLIANACSNDSERTLVPIGENGRLELNLTGISNTNLVYRLRNATFRVTGRATGFVAAVNTEAEPDRSSLLVELAPDTYEVLLEPGFYLELLPGGLPIAARRGDASRQAPGKLSPRARINAFAADAGTETPPVGEPPVPPGSSVVDATLISSNPGVVTIAPNVVSPLNFIFQVGDVIVETGNGVLDIGIGVVDNGRVCSADEFEPNDDQAQPTPITPGVQVAATLCGFDVDNFSFPAPVATGERFSVIVGFQHALGDIDAALIEAASGLFVAFGTSVSDNEVLTATSNGGDYILQTFMFFDEDGGGNSYTVDIGEYVNLAENECCEPSFAPGCNDDAVLACVCEADPFCCQFGFDPICVTQAIACGTTCSTEGAESDCCSASGVPGCTDPAVNTCVCGTDFNCCSTSFDEVCVAQAIAECGAECTLPAPESNCCSASPVPGCTVSEVQACVCGIDPFCCAGGFDENCAALAESQCGAICVF